MNANRTNILRSGALFLLSGVAFSSIGCKNLNNHESLFFTIKANDLEVTFCDRGASIYSIKYKDQIMTYHPEDKEVFLKDDYYYGKALGRVAGRIKDGDLNVEGKHYQLDINENDQAKGGLKNNNIHGGKDAITTRNFMRSVSEIDDTIKISFSYVSPAMESGFPHEVECKYVYTMYKNSNTIDLDIKGTPTGVTPLNLSNHPYFNLGGSTNVLDHKLTLPDSEYLAKFEYSEDRKTDQVVHGVTALDEVSSFDFRESKKIGSDIQAAYNYDITSGGYDHIWKYKNGKNCKVILENEEKNVKLDVDSDADAIIMYANCYPHDDLIINPSKKDTKYGAITIEPVKFFTKDTIEADLNCSPDKPYTRHISYKFSNIK